MRLRKIALLLPMPKGTSSLGGGFSHKARGIAKKGAFEGHFDFGTHATRAHTRIWTFVDPMTSSSETSKILPPPSRRSGNALPTEAEPKLHGFQTLMGNLTSPN